MQLMWNLNTLYFLLTAYAAMAIVRWLVSDLHKYLLTRLDVIYAFWKNVLEKRLKTFTIAASPTAWRHWSCVALILFRDFGAI